MTKFYWEGKEIYSTKERKRIALEECKKFCLDKSINHWEVAGNAKNHRIVEQRVIISRHLKSLGFGYISIGHAINKDHTCIGNYLRYKMPKVGMYDHQDNVIKVDGEQVAVLNYFSVLPAHYKQQFCNQFANKHNISAKGIKINYEHPRKDLPSWTPEMRK